MRIFVAGATGVIGSRLVPLLVGAGHVVAGMTRSQEKAADLGTQGAQAVIADVFDLDQLRKAVSAFHPELIIHQLTALPDDIARVGEFAAANARIRREGTDHLLSAARAAGTTRFIAQSVAWPLEGESGAAVAYLESAVLDFGGTVLRYGQLYGPGTFHESAPPPPPRIHVEVAATRTLAALDAPPGILEISEATR
ncbi:MAG TPA: NAD(P)-dependent oxidoreductase [Acidimicrobiia bacterium]|nr:NAD(P)-dependent oxidoreductase [Acidimicrobiia bacterium]